MTKSELRKARKESIAAGFRLSGELAIQPNKTASNRTVNRRNSRKRAAARKAAK